MTRNIILAAVAAFLFSFGPGAIAQEPHHSEISVAHPGVAKLKADLEKLLSYANAQDQAQLQNVLDFIDLFAFGLDAERPVRVDVLTGIAPSPYVVSAAYKNDPELEEPGAKRDEYAQLLENLDSNYITRKSVENLFELLPPDQGWLRLMPALKSASLVLTTASDHALMKQFILKITDPLADVAPILADNASMGVGLKNQANSADDQKKRKDSFAEIRTNRMDALQKRPAESATTFEIRKGFVATQLDELERLMVEGLNLSARVFLMGEQDQAKILFSGEAVPGTSLAKSIELFHKSPDAFASVAAFEGSVLSGRINHPIDDLRRKNAAAIIELMRNDVAAELERASKMTPEQKTASRQLFDGVMELVTDGIATGYVNGMVESVLDDAGKFVMIGAVSAKDAQRLDEILKLVPKTGDGNKLDPNVAKAGNVNIHRLQLAKGFVKLLDKAVGAEQEFYVGVSPNIVWYATGKGSLELLKKTIEGLKEPADSKVVLKVDARLLSWVKHWEQVAKEQPEPAAVEDKQPWRDRLRVLGQAVESFQEKDEFHFDTKVEGPVVTGEVHFDKGALRLVGRLIATFSKNNLE